MLQGMEETALSVTVLFIAPTVYKIVLTTKILNIEQTQISFSFVTLPVIPIHISPPCLSFCQDCILSRLHNYLSELHIYLWQTIATLHFIMWGDGSEQLGHGGGTGTQANICEES